VPLCTDLTCAAAIGNVFFEVYLVSAPVLSGTRLPQFSDQGRSFGRLFSHSFFMTLFVLLTHVLFLCTIVARSVSLATHWQWYVCTADSVIAMTELAYIALYSGMKLHLQEVLAVNTLLHYRTRDAQMEGKSTLQLSA